MALNKYTFRMLIFMPLSLVLLVFLTSCAYSTPLHERLIIEAIGIDYENDEYTVTVQYLETEKSEYKESISVVSDTGSTVFDALSNLSSKTQKVPMYSHNAFLLIGESTAYKGVSECLDFFVRHYEARPSCLVFIAKDAKASEVLTLKNKDELVSLKEISDFYSNPNNTSGIMISSVLIFISDLENSLSDPCATTLCIIKKDDKNFVDTTGTAIFNKDKLVGFLNKNETIVAKLIRDGSVKAKIASEDADTSKTYEIISSKRKISMDKQNENLQFSLNMKINANVYDTGKSHINNRFQNASNASLKLSLEDAFEKLCTDTISKVINNFKSEIFNFGRYVLKQDPACIKELSSKEDFLKHLEFLIDVNVKIAN